MGFGTLGKLPTGVFHRRIDARESEYTITRTTQQLNDAGETEPVETTHTVDLWAYTPRNLTEQIESGERTRGTIQLLANPETDITFDDQLTHDNVDYEVASITAYPSEAQVVYYKCTCVRRDGP